MNHYKNIERTLVILKPDAVQRGIIGEIITRFERSGLKIIGIKMVYATPELAGTHYSDNEDYLSTMGEKTLAAYKKKGIDLGRTPLEHGRVIRKQLMDFLSSSPIITIVMEGHNAVAQVRKLVGSTAPADSPPGTIRGDYSFETYEMADGLNRPLKNLIHASGAADEAEKEIRIWFSESEIYSWKKLEDDLFYSGSN